MTTPIADLAARLLSAGCPPDMVVEAIRALEVATQETARASRSAVQTVERRRELDKLLKRKRRAESAGQTETPLTLTSNLPSVVSESTIKKGKKVRAEPQESPPDKADIAPREKVSQGERLPDNWAPSEAHYAQGEKLGLSREAIDTYAGKMRNWAEANAHRAVARKAGLKGWDAAFRNWLADKSERNGETYGSGRRHEGAGGAQQRFGFSGLSARLRAKSSGYSV